MKYLADNDHFTDLKGNDLKEAISKSIKKKIKIWKEKQHIREKLVDN